MELLFQDQKIQFKQETSVDFIIEKINSLIGDSYYLSHLIVDGINVYDDPEMYLTENISKIKVVEVIAQTQGELINTVLLSAENYIASSLTQMGDLTNGFYNIPTSEHWAYFSNMLEGIQWMHQVITSIDQMNHKPFNWDNYINLASSMQKELKNMEEALENKDYVLIGDIINYELLPMYKAFQQEIKLTIDTEGKRYDVN